MASEALGLLDRELWEFVQAEEDNPVTDEAWNEYRGWVIAIFGGDSND